jgi:2-methylcitrate dehydratase
MDGELTPRQFAGRRWEDPATKALTAKVRLGVSEELGRRAPGSMPCRISVHLAGGERVEAECLFPPGHSFPDRGLDKAPVVEKFLSVTEPLMSRARQAQVLDAVLGLRERASIAPVMAMLGSEPK